MKTIYSMIAESWAPHRIELLFDMDISSFNKAKREASNREWPKSPNKVALSKALFIHSIQHGFTLEQHLDFKEKYLAAVKAWRGEK